MFGTSWRRCIGGAILSAAVATLSFAAAAADLRFVIGVGPTTLDPHFHNYFSNQGMHPNVYEPLVDSDPDGKIVPALAESWRTLGPTVWEFRLRKNVKFHNGAPFTAADVAATVQRIRDIKGSPGSMAPFTQDIAAIDIIDDHTIRLRTNAPAPTLLNQLIRVLILSKDNKATSAEIDAGKGAVGTGPYKSVKYVRDNEWIVERNPDWWGVKQPWDRVIFKTLTNDASRLAAFLSGDFDVMQGVPLTNIKALKNDQRFRIYAKPALQSWWIALDTARDSTPDVTDADGAPMAKNPLRDARVRRALLMSINRQALVDRFLEGYGVVASQIVAPAVNEGLDQPVVPYDPEGAKALLREAGYPNGFRLKLTGLVGVLPLDDQICQAIGQFFTRIGVRTTVESLPPSVVIPRAVRGELSVYFTGSPTPDAYSPLKVTQMTPDAPNGFGSGNRMKYSNPAFDGMMKKVLVTIDAGERRKLLGDALKTLLSDTPVLPLFHQSNTWVARKGIVYRPGGFLTNQGALATPEK